MRDIYMVAEKVLTWLGPLPAGLDGTNKAQLYAHIAKQPYWTRVWIIQEFVLGRRVILQCGHMRVDWELFDKELKESVILIENFQMIDLFDLKRNVHGRSLNIANAMSFALRSVATDPRDRVYGMLGLVDSANQALTLQPDYTLSACEIFHRTITCILMSNRSLSLGDEVSKPQSTKRHIPKYCNGHKCGALRKLQHVCWMVDVQVLMGCKFVRQSLPPAEGSEDQNSAAR